MRGASVVPPADRHLGLDCGVAPRVVEEGGPDTSGTNPANFLRTAKLANEYASSGGGDGALLVTPTLALPFGGGRWNFRAKLPVSSVDFGELGETGLGDLSLRTNWIPHVDAGSAVLVGADLTLDTASEDVLGRGQAVLAPVVTYALFLDAQRILAPSYQHNAGLGSGDDPDLSEGVIDLYYVMTAADKRSWWTIDPAAVIDYESSDEIGYTLEVERGWSIGKALGGGLNFSVRPGIGIGDDRPFDWNLEIALATVGW